VACFCLVALPVQAAPAQQQASRATSWLCWIVSAETFYIRCVLDTDSREWREPETNAGDHEIMEQFRARFDAGAGREELEHLFQLFGDKFEFANFWFIPVYNEPYETSWQEERPQQLVRAYLCTGDAGCRVRFQRN
ncbi:MAG TPA: hypothetical protein VGK14_05420, partial [Novimethylophilus sp.]|jgi:hypothetical protein|uniref:hypothetical protein n=1 Tax=Novimethylophilus sp. TaxID=2137426 RepID=UPI002F3E93FA